MRLLLVYHYEHLAATACDVCHHHRTQLCHSALSATSRKDRYYLLLLVWSAIVIIITSNVFIFRPITSLPISSCEYPAGSRLFINFINEIQTKKMKNLSKFLTIRKLNPETKYTVTAWNVTTVFGNVTAVLEKLRPFIPERRKTFLHLSHTARSKSYKLFYRVIILLKCYYFRIPVKLCKGGLFNLTGIP